MKHPIIEQILTEWAYRVDDGMPNPKNPLHMIQLRESMEKLNLPKDFIFEFIQNLLNEEQKFYARNPKGKQISVFTNKDNWQKALGSGYEKVSDDEAEKELGKHDKEEPDGEKKSEGQPKETPPSKPKITKIDKHQFTGDDDEYKEDKWKIRSIYWLNPQSIKKEE